MLLDFLLQVTAFISLMTFDFIRTEENRVDCFPCIRVGSLATELEHGMHTVLGHQSVLCVKTYE